MTRRPKHHRPPEPCDPERLEQTASGGWARLASGSFAQVRRHASLLAVCGLLVLAVIAVFGQTACHSFVNLDDGDYVYENLHVRGGLSGEAAVWSITAFHAGNWHPLTWLSHMLDCQIFGLAPGGHHLTNVLLHAATAILLLLALRRMTGALWPSAWVAAVFAIHSLRVESVAWVAERKDVLSGLFFMLTLWFYARYAERPASWGRYLLVVASFALGLTAKPMLVTVPFVLLLLDYWPLGRLGRGLSRFSGHHAPSMVDENGTVPFLGLPIRLVVEKIPLLVLAAASCAVTLAAQHVAVQSLEHVAFSWRLANAAVAYVAYLGKMFCPAGLVVFYPLPQDPPPLWEVAAAVAVLVAISTAVFAARRRCPYLLVGWLWYLGTLVPVIGLVQVGGQAMADRYTYLTQIGLYAAIAWGATSALGVAGRWPYRRWALAAVSSLVVAGLTVCAWQQTRHWRDTETLWAHAVACTSQNPRAHTNLGLALAGRGRADDAILQFREALEIDPHYAAAHYNLGLALAGRGQVDEAIAQYRKTLEIKPDYVAAHNNLGTALAGRGQADEAIEHYRKALEINPEYVLAHNNLGLVLADRGQVGEAITHYRKALEISPDYAEAHYNLGLALAGRGQVGEAIEHYGKALGLASARNDRALAGAIRAQIRLLRPVAPARRVP